MVPQMYNRGNVIEIPRCRQVSYRIAKGVILFPSSCRIPCPRTPTTLFSPLHPYVFHLCLWQSSCLISPWDSAQLVLLFYCGVLTFASWSSVPSDLCCHQCFLFRMCLFLSTNQCPLSLYGSVLFLIGSPCLFFPFMDATYS